MQTQTVDTIYGRFGRPSKPRLDLTYDYEHGTIRAFRRLAERLGARRVLDIGANIGVYAAYLSTLPGMERLDCFEPAPEAFAELERNAGLQPAGAAPIHVHRIALSDRAGTARLATWGPMAGNNMLTDDMARDKKPRAVVEVARETLDGALARAPVGAAPFVAKIDVEGHEAAVIAGGRATLSGSSGLVQVESFGERADALREAMAGLGHAWIGRLKDDHFFTNAGEAMHEPLRAILWEESAAELHRLKTLRAMRRRTVKLARRMLDEVKYGGDPLALGGPEDGDAGDGD